MKVVDPRGHATYMTYDALHRLTHTENQVGAVRRSVFDAEGNVTRSIDPLGQTTYFTFDLAGRRTHTEDQLGNVTYVGYDVANQTTLRVDPLGYPTYMGYDAAGRQQSLHASSGLWTYHAYDLVGNLTAQSLDQGWGRQPWGCSPYGGERATTYFTYDGLNRRTQSEDALGGVSSNQYDAVSNLTRTVDARGVGTYFSYDALDRRTHSKDGVHFAQTYMGYDAAGNVVLDVDRLGFAAYYTFDRLNRREFVHDRADALSYFAFDAAGNQTERHVLLGAGGERRSTYFTFDQVNRQTQVEDALGGVQVTEYRLTDDRSKVVDQVGRPSYFGYDALNRPVTRRNASGDTWTTVYDARGSVSKRVDPEGRTAYFSYDGAGRQTAQENLLGEVSRFCYDARGSRTATVTPRGFATYFRHDLLGRQTHREDALGGVRYFGFDAVGNQVLRLDELGRPAYFTFDGLRRLTESKDAALAVTYMGYDARGGLVVRVAPSAVGEVAYMGYDAAGRVEREWFAKSGGGADAPIYFGYDQVGNLLTVQDSTILSANYFTHDKLNRLTKKSTAGGAVYYAFDASGKRTSLKDRDLEESVYVWDADGRLSKLELSGARAAYFAYDQAGMVTRRVLPGGPSSGRVNAYFTYDLGGRLERLEHRGPAYTQVIAYFAYERDTDGAITRIRHEDSENSYFRYDALGRLEWERRVTDAASRYEKYYGYDAASNRVLKIDHKLAEHTYYSHDVRNLLEKEWNQDAPETTYFEWDASQRMTAAKNPTGQTAYFGFDQRDQNSQILFRKVGGGADQTRTFGYTGTGERVRLALGAGTMFDPITSELALSYDGGKLLAERESLTSTTVRRYRHNEGPADSRGSAVEVEQGSDKLYPSMDERGSVIVLSEGGSTNENRYGYDSFGVDVPISEPLITTSQRARFTSPVFSSLSTTQAILATHTPGLAYLPIPAAFVRMLWQAAADSDRALGQVADRPRRRKLWLWTGGIGGQQEWIYLGATKERSPFPEKPDDTPPRDTPPFTVFGEELDVEPCCGPDITETLIATINKIGQDYDALSLPERASNCANLLPLIGNPAGAWDTAFLDQGLFTDYPDAAGCAQSDTPCAGTVELAGRCFNSAVVNWAMYGTIATKCSGRFDRDAGRFGHWIWDTLYVPGLYGGPSPHYSEQDLMIRIGHYLTDSAGDPWNRFGIGSMIHKHETWVKFFWPQRQCPTTCPYKTPPEPVSYDWTPNLSFSGWEVNRTKLVTSKK